MKTTFSTIIFIAALGGIFISCSDHSPGIPPHGETGVAVPPKSMSGNNVSNAGFTTAVSGGPNLKGVTVPTTTGIVSRIQNSLGVMSTAGNFQRALGQVRTNLPNSTDVKKVAGFDQAQLLVYAACSDLTTGTTSLMKSRYNVDPATPWLRTEVPWSQPAWRCSTLTPLGLRRAVRRRHS